MWILKTVCSWTLVLHVIVAHPALSHRVSHRSLPDKIIVGYANWEECDAKLVDAVRQGVNVLIWFSINLAKNPTTGLPEIMGGPNLDCVSRTIQEIEDLGLPTTHLISIGGWNSPHPDTSNSPEAVFQAWRDWNNGLFDGLDWDIEGNDDPASVYNHFTPACLDLMGHMSQLAKRDGFVVAMAPAESYLDMTTSSFDLDLNHTYPEWTTLQPSFNYHGHNTYAYLLAKFSKTWIESKQEAVRTFDFVTVQLYEGYSHAEYNTSVLQQTASDYLVQFALRATAGWTVDFGPHLLGQELSREREREPSNAAHAVGDALSGSATISVPASELVVGLANGWAGDGKFILMYPDEVQAAYLQLQAVGIHLRGFAFWNIADEGKASVQRPDVAVWLASGLNNFMHIRPDLDSVSIEQTP